VPNRLYAHLKNAKLPLKRGFKKRLPSILSIRLIEWVWHDERMDSTIFKEAKNLFTRQISVLVQK